MLARVIVMSIAAFFISGVAHAQDSTTDGKEALTAAVDEQEIGLASPAGLSGLQEESSATEVARGSLFGIKPGEPLPSDEGFEEYLDNDGLGQRVLNWTGGPLTLQGEQISSLVVRVRDGVVTQMEISLTTERNKRYSALKTLTNDLCERVGTLRRNKTGHRSTHLMVKGKCRGDVEDEIFVLVQERHSSNQDTNMSRSAVEVTVRVPAPPRSVMRRR